VPLDEEMNHQNRSGIGLKEQEQKNRSIFLVEWVSAFVAGISILDHPVL